MKTVKLETWILTGLMAAMATVGTMLVQIPTPMKGYIHLGDSVVYLCGILLGPVMGGLAAGIGSMFADLFSGYAVFAPATLVIKFMDAAIVGYVYLKIVGDNSSVARKLVAYTVSVALGGLMMVGGYFTYEVFISNFAGAVGEIPANLIQAAGDAVIAYPLVLALDRLKVFDRFVKATHS